eukprot:scaffold126413_cov42-Phaeocystis_antarctica.AAC.1
MARSRLPDSEQLTYLNRLPTGRRHRSTQRSVAITPHGRRCAPKTNLTLLAPTNPTPTKGSYSYPYPSDPTLTLTLPRTYS